MLRQLVGTPGRTLLQDARFLALAEMAWADSNPCCRRPGTRTTGTLSAIRHVVNWFEELNALVPLTQVANRVEVCIFTAMRRSFGPEVEFPPIRSPAVVAAGDRRTHFHDHVRPFEACLQRGPTGCHDAGFLLKRLRGTARRRIVPLILLADIVAYVDRVNVSFASLPMNDDQAPVAADGAARRR